MQSTGQLLINCKKEIIFTIYYTAHYQLFMFYVFKILLLRADNLCVKELYKLVQFFVIYIDSK